MDDLGARGMVQGISWDDFQMHRRHRRCGQFTAED
jgi:hypothetical protein